MLPFSGGNEPVSVSSFESVSPCKSSAFVNDTDQLLVFGVFSLQVLLGEVVQAQLIRRAIQVSQGRRINYFLPERLFGWLVPSVDSCFTEGFDVESSVVEDEKFSLVESPSKRLRMLCNSTTSVRVNSNS